MAEVLNLTFEVTLTNSSLAVTGAFATTEQDFILYFGRVFKGDTPVLTATADGTIYSDGVLLTEVVKNAAALANTKAALADEKATLANTKAGLADAAATLANTKAGLADAAATLANTKAGLADTAATNANTEAAAAHAAAVSAGLRIYCTQAQYDAWKQAGTLHADYEYNIYEEE